jgi:hypothetical protein
MHTDEQLRQVLRQKLSETVNTVNAALRGKGLGRLEQVLARLGRGNRLPHWYTDLKNRHSLPNLDGKTVGSVVEMLLVAVMQEFTFAGVKAVPELRINPARGVDLPDLDLGVKSPSENFCTSEPFFSAYERLLGSDHDLLVLLTDYQKVKRSPPLKLQITDYRYLLKTQIADENLCAIARKHRDWLLETNEAWAKKVFRFLAFVNQSDWQAKRLVRLIDRLSDRKLIEQELADCANDFGRKNQELSGKNKLPIPDSDLQALTGILKIKPFQLGVIDAADNWVVEVQKDLGRFPNDNEWGRLKNSPLDGRIGMSFALQWRYNFGRLFGQNAVTTDDEVG